MKRAGNRLREWTIGLLLLVGLAGCGGQAPPGPATAADDLTATPTLPRVIHLVRPPELEAWDDVLAACAPAGPILLAIAPSDDTNAGEWRLTWGPPSNPTVAAYALGEDGWALVVHADNPIRRVPASAWAALWTDPTATWERLTPQAQALSPPMPVVPPPGSALAQALSAQVGEAWRVHPRARLAPRPEDTIRIVAEHRGAVGLIPEGWALWARKTRPDLPWGSVRLLTAPAVPPWRASVVLSTTHAPSAAALRWVRCAQEQGRP